MSDQSVEIKAAEKKTFTFGFSKTKPKINLSQNEKAKEFQSEDKSKSDASKVELIKSIEGTKLSTVHKSADDDKKKPLVIPCAKNNLIFDLKREEIRKSKANEREADKLTSNETNMTSTATAKIDDLAAINALIADSKEKKIDKDKVDLKIPLDEIQTLEEKKVEEPDYERIDLEKFGMAALRGMGWSEKSGMGLTNKRSIPVYEPELRPKGLGLGAGSNKKPRPGESGATDSGTSQESSTSSLKYVKGAYVQILNGKRLNEYGQIVSFDDGLNRILVKLASDDTTISLIQNYTRLLTKTEYMNATEKVYRK